MTPGLGLLGFKFLPTSQPLHCSCASSQKWPISSDSLPLPAVKPSLPDLPALQRGTTINPLSQLSTDPQCRAAIPAAPYQPTVLLSTVAVSNLLSNQTVVLITFFLIFNRWHHSLLLRKQELQMGPFLLSLWPPG